MYSLLSLPVKGIPPRGLRNGEELEENDPFSVPPIPRLSLLGWGL